MIRNTKSRYAVAKSLGMPLSTLYYKKKLPEKDRALKIRIEEALRYHPSYGHRRLALHLALNKKRVLRVMHCFGIKPYRRRSKKGKKYNKITNHDYPNLARYTIPLSAGCIWAADFTYLPFRKGFVYLSTIIDVFSREIVGWSVMTRHGAALVLQTLFHAIGRYGRPQVFHSDNGREYVSAVMVRALTELGVAVSRTAPASPWENASQESFYSQFKIDLGDPERFASLGELVYAIHRTIWEYNHTRIHLALKMPPKLFAEQHKNLVENYSNKRGT